MRTLACTHVRTLTHFNAHTYPHKFAHTHLDTYILVHTHAHQTIKHVGPHAYMPMHTHPPKETCSHVHILRSRHISKLANMHAHARL